MTTEEAIKVIKEGERDFCEIYQSECLGKTCNKCEGSIAYNMAIKALEKQIPKKPYDVDTECKTFDCPACLSKLYADEDVRDCIYCCVCGQALDWGEEE